VKKHERGATEQHKVFGQCHEERDCRFLHKYQYMSLFKAEVAIEVLGQPLLKVHL
jgi:hypothetical protein